MRPLNRYGTRLGALSLLLTAQWLLLAPTWAHESRPAYLEIKETAPNQFSVLWRTPVLSGNRLLVALKLPDGWMLLKTVTAFTVAHSITLALATLGVVQPARPPVEVAIALLILFLAPEILRNQRGEMSFTLQHPWIVAFVFGLLHGFGFSSVLIDAGLPRSELPLALLSFNVGVEIGQLAFVSLLLVIWASFRNLHIDWPRWSRQVPAYLVGTLGAFWTVRGLVLIFRAVS